MNSASGQKGCDGVKEFTLKTNEEDSQNVENSGAQLHARVATKFSERICDKNFLYFAK
jgi:hypothetical protein